MTAHNTRGMNMPATANLTPEWSAPTHAHPDHSCVLTGADMYRLLGDQRISFNLTAAAPAATWHHAPEEAAT